MDQRNERLAVSMVCFRRQCWAAVLLHGTSRFVIRRIIVWWRRFGLEEVKSILPVRTVFGSLIFIYGCTSLKLVMFFRSFNFPHSTCWLYWSAGKVMSHWACFFVFFTLLTSYLILWKYDPLLDLVTNSDAIVGLIEQLPFVSVVGFCPTPVNSDSQWWSVRFSLSAW